MAIGYNQGGGNGDKTILLKVELDVKQLKLNAESAAGEVQRLNDIQTKLKTTTGTSTVEYAKNAEALKQARKALSDNAAALQINEQLAGKQNLTSVEQARLQKALAVSYNSLTEEERENTEAGRKITEQYKQVNEALQKQGLAVSDGRRSVGLYEKSIRAALAEITSLKKEQSTVSTAIGYTTKKVEESKKALDNLGNTVDKTTAEYQQAEKELEKYTVNLQTQQVALSQVNSELKEQESVLKIATEEAEKIGFVYGNNEAAADSLKKQLRDLKAELAIIAEEQGATSDAFIEGTERAGELADRIKDINEAVAAKASGSKFEQLSNQIGLLSGDLTNLDFEGVAEKAKALQQTAASISFKDLIGGAKQAGSALVSLGKTLITSPLFLVLAAAAAFIYFFDDIKKAINGTNVAQEALNDTVDEYRTGAADAGKKTLMVKNAFDLARKGVISKQEALKTYNDTLGDSFGKTNNLNKAEELFNSKTSAYVKSAGLRAQAQALIAKAADEQANALTAQFEDQTSFIDREIAAQKLKLGFVQSANKTLADSQKEGVAEAKKTAEARAKILNDEAAKLLQQAEEAENANGIISDSEKELNDELARLAKERAEKAAEAAKARIAAEKEAAEKIRELILGNRQLSADNEREALEAETEFKRQMAELQFKDEKTRLEALLSIQVEYNQKAAAIDAEDKAARIAKIESDAKAEIATVKGTKEQQTEQIRLINQRTAEQLESLDVEYGRRQVERDQAVSDQTIAIADATNAALVKSDEERLKLLEAGLQHEKNVREKALQEELKAAEAAGASAEELQELEARRRIEIANATREKRIEIAKLENQIIVDDASKTDADKVKAAAELEAKLNEISAEGTEYRKGLNQELSNFINNQLVQSSIQAAQQLADSLFKIKQNQIQSDLDAVAASSDNEQKLLQKQLDSGLISEEKFAEEQKKIQEKQAEEEAKLKKEKFKKQKAADLIQAGINVAIAITQALAGSPPPLSFILAGITAATGAAEIAAIASAKEPAFAEGGKVLSGQRIESGHGRRIRRSNGDNLLATVRTGEVILNEQQQAALGGYTTFARIGVPGFAAGGAIAASQLTRPIDTQQQQQLQIMDAISRLPAPVVYVEDIRAGNERAVSVEQSGNIFNQ